jgi:ATP diphosphatase
MTASPDLPRLLEIMAKLRHPERGCPWDLEQSFATIAPYTIEEAYEVAEAAERGEPEALKDELGDLLLQVVFHSRMAEEARQFDFNDVARGIADKMIRRHPHVFGDAEVDGSAAQTVAWEAQKAEERHAKALAAGRPESALDGVGLGLPALTRAEKLQKRAARVGFDWPSTLPVFDKIAEEIGELRAEIDQDAPAERLSDELGDLLFAVVNLSRKLAIDPEQALRGANRKFERRFHAVEQRLAARGKAVGEASLDQMEVEWQQVKREER